MRNRGKARLIIYLFLLVTLLVFTWLKSRRSNVNEEVKRTTNVRISANRNHGFQRDINFLEYTRHARCRMDCRSISVPEVEEIMQTGTINYRKSNVKAKPCPVYALEGLTTHDQQKVRIVFAQCDEKTKVVTCIDLDKEYECACN